MGNLVLESIAVLMSMVVTGAIEMLTGPKASSQSRLCLKVLKAKLGELHCHDPMDSWGTRIRDCGDVRRCPDRQMLRGRDGSEEEPAKVNNGRDATKDRQNSSKSVQRMYNSQLQRQIKRRRRLEKKNRNSCRDKARDEVTNWPGRVPLVRQSSPPRGYRGRKDACKRAQQVSSRCVAAPTSCCAFR
jgi:hypothetical protein